MTVSITADIVYRLVLGVVLVVAVVLRRTCVLCLRSYTGAKNSCQLAAYLICHTQLVYSQPTLIRNSYTTRILVSNSSYTATGLTQ